MVGHIALKATGLPILNNVLLKAEKNTLTLVATNLEAGIQHSVRGKIEEDGECLVPARLLLDLLPLLPGGPLTLEGDTQGLTLTTDNGKTTLRTTPTSDFPIVPTLEQTSQTITASRQAIVDAIGATSFAVGRVEQRPQFSGVFMTTKGKTITFVATDGYRLAEATVGLKKLGNMISHIVPFTTVQEVARMLQIPDQDDDVVITTTENQIHFACGATQVTSRLIDGSYPDYLPLFPEKPTTVCQAAKSELIRAVKSANLFSHAGMADVTLSIVSGASALEVYAENTEVGAHRMKISSQGSGAAVAITLKARYLIDGLGATHGASVTLSLTSADRPLLLTPAEKSQTLSYRYLLMPIRQ